MFVEPTPVLVFTCDRPAYLRRALDAIFANDDEPGRSVFVSQDGLDERVTAVVRQFGSRIEHLSYTEPIRDGSQPRHAGKGGSSAEFFEVWKGYFRIAQHFGWAFRQLFDERGLDRVIVIEDDLEIAPDFFNYFRAAAGLMDRDPSIWTVSAWNDNGYPTRVERPERLLRSDFFPGLGWLMTRALWNETRESWPLAHWDDWLRQPSRRQGRSVIYPEISRTYNYGREGSGTRGFYDTYLAPIKLNDVAIDFTNMDLDYLVKDRYDAALDAAVRDARLVSPERLALTPDGDVKILYHREQSYDRLADKFGFVKGFRQAGLPRCSYQGVVSFLDGGRRVYLVSLSYASRGLPDASRAVLEN